MAPLLGYWNIRGLAQPLRLILGYGGVEFEEKRYNYGAPPQFDRGEWLSEKHNLGLEFPNLPYYIDGDLKITQSLAVCRHLARKFDLVASKEKDLVLSDMVEQQIIDLRNPFVTLCYSQDHENLKKTYLNNLPASLTNIEKVLGNKSYLVGEKLTYVDFLLYELLDQLKLFQSDCLDNHSILRKFKNRFEEIPEIKKFMKSEKFMKWPINGAMAKFGSIHSDYPEH